MESIYEQMAVGRICKHGTNLGTPGGIDLMCGYCEDGISDAEYEALLRAEATLQRRRNRRDRLLNLLPRVASDPAKVDRLMLLVRQAMENLRKGV